MLCVCVCVCVCVYTLCGCVSASPSLPKNRAGRRPKTPNACGNTYMHAYTRFLFTNTCTHTSIYVLCVRPRSRFVFTIRRIARNKGRARQVRAVIHAFMHTYLAFTRFCFVSGPLCTNQYYSLRTHFLFRQPTPPRHRPRDCAIYHVSPGPLVFATYTTQYWQRQYRVKAKYIHA